MTDEPTFPGVLHPENDSVLIADIVKYCEIAGLSGPQMQYVWRSIKDFPAVTDKDRETAKLIPNLITKHGKHGLVYEHSDLNELSIKFMAMTGLFVRNYLDGRYFPLSALQKLVIEDRTPECRALFIPDFVVDQATDLKGVPSAMPEWKKEMFLGLLLQRQAAGQVTVLGVSSTNNIKKTWGKSAAEFLDSAYVSVP
jgi:hypothetical protein